MQSQCRLLAVNLLLFWAESVRLDRQPLTLGKGQGLGLTTGKALFCQGVASNLALPPKQRRRMRLKP